MGERPLQGLFLELISFGPSIPVTHRTHPCTHITDEETEAHSHKATCPRSHSQSLNPGLLIQTAVQPGTPSLLLACLSTHHRQCHGQAADSGREPRGEAGGAGFHFAAAGKMGCSPSFSPDHLPAAVQGPALAQPLWEPHRRVRGLQDVHLCLPS